MKKLFIVMGLAIGGCQSPQTLIMKSDFTAVNQDSTKLWIKDTEFGKHLYNAWKTGVYGDDTKVYLLDSTEFNNLVGTKSKSKNPTVSL
jgi:hypothetical protein